MQIHQPELKPNEHNQMTITRFFNHLNYSVNRPEGIHPGRWEAMLLWNFARIAEGFNTSEIATMGNMHRSVGLPGQTPTKAN